MRSVGVKVLKNRLSEYVHLAAGGEVVLVTDRDRVVAELRPPDSTRAPSVSDAFLAEAVRSGWVTPPVTTSGDAPARKPVASLSDLLVELDAARAER